MEQDFPESLKAEMWPMWVNKITHEHLHENVQLVYLGWLILLFVSAEPNVKTHVEYSPHEAWKTNVRGTDSREVSLIKHWGRKTD